MQEHTKFDGFFRVSKWVFRVGGCPKPNGDSMATQAQHWRSPAILVAQLAIELFVWARGDVDDVDDVDEVDVVAKVVGTWLNVADVDACDVDKDDMDDAEDACDTNMVYMYIYICIIICIYIYT